MSFTPSVSVRQLLTMLPMSMNQIESIGLGKVLNTALMQSYIDINSDGLAIITPAGHAALMRPHVTQKKVINLLTAAKAALDYIKLIDAPKPLGLVAALTAAIADLEEPK